MFLDFFVGWSHIIEDKFIRDYMKLMHIRETEIKIKDVKILESYGIYNGSDVGRLERGCNEVKTDIMV